MLTHWKNNLPKLVHCKIECSGPTRAVLVPSLACRPYVGNTCYTAHRWMKTWGPPGALERGSDFSPGGHSPLIYFRTLSCHFLFLMWLRECHTHTYPRIPQDIQEPTLLSAKTRGRPEAPGSDFNLEYGLGLSSRTVQTEIVHWVTSHVPHIRLVIVKELKTGIVPVVVVVVVLCFVFFNFS